MTSKIMIATGLAGLAAMTAATPAMAQYAQPYGYQNYGYNNVTQLAAQRCSAAVQNRLSMNNRVGVQGILGSVFGAPTAQGRVLGVTQVTPRRNTVRVRGLASSGVNRGYGQYGVGAYGALAYQYQPDLSFTCSVDYRGYVRDVDINRR